MSRGAKRRGSFFVWARESKSKKKTSSKTQPLVSFFVQTRALSPHTPPPPAARGACVCVCVCVRACGLCLARTPRRRPFFFGVFTAHPVRVQLPPPSPPHSSHFLTHAAHQRGCVAHGQAVPRTPPRGPRRPPLWPVPAPHAGPAGGSRPGRRPHWPPHGGHAGGNPGAARGRRRHAHHQRRRIRCPWLRRARGPRRGRAQAAQTVPVHRHPVGEGVQAQAAGGAGGVGGARTVGARVIVQVCVERGRGDGPGERVGWGRMDVVWCAGRDNGAVRGVGGGRGGAGGQARSARWFFAAVAPPASRRPRPAPPSGACPTDVGRVCGRRMGGREQAGDAGWGPRAAASREQLAARARPLSPSSTPPSTPQVDREQAEYGDIIYIKERTNYKSILYKTYFIFEVREGGDG